MVGYVLRPDPDKGYVGVAIAALGSSGAARGWCWCPPRPAGLPAAARTALLVPASAASLPSAPVGLPKSKSTTVSPAPTFREWRTVASVSAWLLLRFRDCHRCLVHRANLVVSPARAIGSDIGVAFGLDDTARPYKYVRGFHAKQGVTLWAT